jgi:4-amino-4-deoxy-L-arabinose transferase-like glycosyltransferase
MRWRFLLLVLPVGLLYATYLRYAPIYLAHDEVLYSLTAKSIAASGRDLNGQSFPLLFRLSGRNVSYYVTPVIIYTTALFFTVLPVSESAIRLPTALVGVLDVVLIYFVARRIFRREAAAVGAAVLLALTPAHFLHARLATDLIYPTPFVLGWLLCLATFFDRPRPSLIVGATSLLSVGCFSYLASFAMMPLYFVLTCLLLLAYRQPVRTYVMAAAGFVVPFAALLAWIAAHWSIYQELLRLYPVYDSTQLNPVQGVLHLFSRVAAYADVYWTFFNPSFLFLSGDSSLQNSTRQAGVFLLPLAVFIPAGMCHILANRRTPLTLLLIAGFLSAPFAAVLLLDLTIHRALVMIPFGVLIAVFGVEWVLTRPVVWRRVAGWCLLAAIPVQFAWFYRDYMTQYRISSSFWFERDIRGALERVIALEPRDHAVSVYLSSDILWIDSYWRLYLMMHGRTDLAAHTVYIAPVTLSEKALPAGSLLVGNAGEPTMEALITSGALRTVARLIEPDTKPSFVIAESR